MGSRKKVLVTGASGMLGHVLLERLSKSGEYEGIGISLKGREGTMACDLSVEKDIRALFESQKPDLVINTAAYSDVDGCERDPALAYAANAVAVKNLAALCGASGAPLLHVSTDYVFDGRKNSPYLESDPVSPVNIYGLTKLEGEYHARRCRSASAVVRTSWLFGPGNPANFVNAVLARMKREKNVGVLDDQMDAPTSVFDLCGALEKIAARLLSGAVKPAAAEIYQVCNNGVTTRLAMARKIREILSLSDTDVTRTDPSTIRGRLAVRPVYAAMSPAFFEKTFGVKLPGWEESLKEYLLK